MAQAAARRAKVKEEKPQDFFLWEGTDKRGQHVRGQLQSDSTALVRAQLRKQGIKVLKVKKKPKPLFASKAKIKPKDIAIFSRQLATMMSSGVPLVQAFEIIGRGHENASMKELVLTIKGDVESGSPLAVALGKHPKYFDDLTCNLVNAGEQAGILEGLLDKIATYKEKTEAIKGKIKKAMFYPTAVLVVAAVVTAILLLFVVPSFQEVFSSFGADLPALTRMVIHLSELLQEWWWAVFGGIALAGWAFLTAKQKSKTFRDNLQKLSLKMPIFGPILNKAAVARFARTLSTMFAAGVPLVEAMESVSGAVGNAVYRDAVLRMRDDVATGQSLQVSMQMTDLFPNMVVQMVGIGEEAGSLDAMLGKVADFYEEEVDNAVDGLSSLLEPLIMAILGVLIGGLVIAMYLPIFQMGQVV